MIVLSLPNYCVGLISPLGTLSDISYQLNIKDISVNTILSQPLNNTDFLGVFFGDSKSIIARLVTRIISKIVRPTEFYSVTCRDFTFGLQNTR